MPATVNLRVLALRLLVGLAFAILVSWLALSAQPWRSEAAGAGPAMSLRLTGSDVSCGKPTACSIPIAEQFTLVVDVATAPAEGYVGFQTEVYYGQGLSYAASAVGDEITWPASALPVRSQATQLVAHGDTSGTEPPLPASTHTGAIVELAMQCPPTATPLTVALLRYDAVERPLGAGFALSDGGGVGEVAPAKSVGSRNLDIEGVEGPVEIAAAIDVNCFDDSPTPTPTVSATPTVTPTSTPLSQPGDASCDGTVNAIDAALMLQVVAALLLVLPCPENGDASGDGQLTSVDAAIVLQFTAGLLDSL